MNNHDDTKEKNGRLKDHDSALFREFCQSVKPLKQDNRAALTPDRLKKKKIVKEKSFYNSPLESSYEINKKINLASVGAIEKVAANTILHYSQPHLHRNLYRQMKRGTLSIEATIDLHQCTMDEALHKTAQFLHSCREQNMRWVLIIHGKGFFSKKGEPVLKSFLNQWLKTQPCVLAFRSAQPKDGGTGALYVLLKLKKG